LIHPKIKEKEKQSRKTILESVSKSGSKNEKSSEKIQYWSLVLLTKKKKKKPISILFQEVYQCSSKSFSFACGSTTVN
jgi:hypothetical protein